MTEPTDPSDLAEPKGEAETLAVPVAELRPALEAVLMVADQPLDEVALATAVGYPVAEVTRALAALAAEYDAQGRGFELRTVAGGWRYYTREELAPVVERFVLEGQQARLTQAALETLAVVAYQQPVSRARVSAVRGVNVDGVVRTLLARGLVEEAGTDETSGAHLYRTTSYFLERIGVRSLGDLPELAPFLPALEEVEEMEEGGDDEPRSEDVGPADEPAPDPPAGRRRPAGLSVTTAAEVAESGGLVATALAAQEPPRDPADDLDHDPGRAAGWDRFEKPDRTAPREDRPGADSTGDPES